MTTAQARPTRILLGDDHALVRRGLRLILDNEPELTVVQAGAVGYVLKSVADRDLVEACRAAMRDEPFLYPGAVSTLIRNLLDRTRAGRSAKVITDREEEILKLVAEGYSSKQIAEMLVTSVKTVERRRANLLQKLGLRDRPDLTRYAIRAGLVEP